MEGFGNESSQKLFNMMKLSDDMSYDHTYAANYIQRKDITNRNTAVNWMKYCVEHLLGTDCPSTRDTSIQIFDKFILFSSYNEPSILNNTGFLSYSAAASVVLGAKLTDSRTEIKLARFTESDFDMDRLIEFEHNVLTMTCCNISTLCTPSSFLHHMMELTDGVERRDTVLMNADLLIAEFWGEPVSLLYAPSTIAITALLLSFSLLKIPCSKLLNALPLFCFLSPANPFFECDEGMAQDGRPLSPNARFLDHERCIAEFQKMEVMRNYQRSASPAPGTSSTSSTVSPATSSASLSSDCDPATPPSAAEQSGASSASCFNSGSRSCCGGGGAHNAATVTPTRTPALGAKSRGERSGEGSAGRVRSPVSVTASPRQRPARRGQEALKLVADADIGAGTSAATGSPSSAIRATDTDTDKDKGKGKQSPSKRVRRA